MLPRELAFALLAAMTVGGGAMVAFSRRITYAAFSLLFTFLGVAGLYALLAADFLAIAQIIVYVGGILVLLLFGVMLTQRIYDVQVRAQRIQPVIGGIAAAAVLAVLLMVVFTTDWPVSALPEPTPTTALLGEGFMKRYLFPFEFISMIILIALIGAALIARREGDAAPSREDASPVDEASAPGDEIPPHSETTSTSAVPATTESEAR